MADRHSSMSPTHMNTHTHTHTHRRVHVGQERQNEYNEMNDNLYRLFYLHLPGRNATVPTLAALIEKKRQTTLERQRENTPTAKRSVRIGVRMFACAICVEWRHINVTMM